MRNLWPAAIVRFLGFFFLLSCILAGCGKASEDGGPAAGTPGSWSGAGGSRQTCTPYETISCACMGGVMSTQQCDAYGTSYGECNCPQTGAGTGLGGVSGSGVSGTGGSAGTQGGAGGTSGMSGSSGSTPVSGSGGFVPVSGSGGLFPVSGNGGASGFSGASGSFGTGGSYAQPTCPPGYSCQTNDLLNMFIGGGAGVKFCAGDDPATWQTALFVSGPTPPACVTPADCTNLGFTNATCMEMLGFKGCVQRCF